MLKPLDRIVVPASGLATLDFTKNFSSNYDRYVLLFNNLRRNDTMPGGFPGQEGVFASTNGGESFDTGSVYSSAATALVNASAAGGTGPNPANPQGIAQLLNAATGMVVGVDCLNPATFGLTGQMTIVTDGKANSYYAETGRLDQAGNILKSNYFGYYTGSNDRINALRIALVPAGALFIGGSVDIYGLAHH